MLATDFDPAKHGFQFSNNDIRWEVHPGGPHGSFLCGGMIYTALDHRHFAMQMPKDAVPPPVRTPLNNYIYRRQMRAHVMTVGRLTGGTIFPFTQQWFVDSVASEFDRIRAGIAANKPVPVFLVKTTSFAGHHVLAIGCQSSPSLGNPILNVYDPNRPGVISEIHADHTNKLFHNRAPKSSSGGMVLRGFFVDTNYSPERPPVFAPPSPPMPPGPTPPNPTPPGPLPPPIPPGPLPPPPLPPGPVTRIYTVQRGDSLSLIAKRMYADANRWPVIYNANRGTIGPNPNLIHPGQKLSIPTA